MSLSSTYATFPRTFPRHQLIPLDGTGWLRPAPPSELALQIFCGVMVVLLLTVGRRWWQVLSMTLVFLLGLGSWWLSWGLRNAVQVCPDCLTAMPRTARRCPACRFLGV